MSSTRVRIGLRRLVTSASPTRRDDPPDRDPAVLHRHEFAQVFCFEGPSVDDLLARGVDHFDPLAFGNTDRFTVARRDLDHRLYPLGLTVDEPTAAC